MKTALHFTFNNTA